MVCVADGVDGEVVDDTARGHIRVSLRVNVGVTFPRLPRPELCVHTHTKTYHTLISILLVQMFFFICPYKMIVIVPGGQVTVFPWGGGELARGGQPSPTEPIGWPGGLKGDGPGDRKS